MYVCMTYMERKEDQELRRELKEKREESNKKQDRARWIIRRGRVVNTARPERLQIQGHASALPQDEVQV